MSRFITSVTNTVPRLVLASPMHRLMSKYYVTLHFTGRKSGRRYHLPVAYVDTGDGLVISTDSGWWRNIAGGQAFTVTFRRRRHKATASPLENDEALDALRKLVELPGYTKAAGIERINGEVAENELVRAAGERIVLAIDVGEPA